jgi:hypothetical protein
MADRPRGGKERFEEKLGGWKGKLLSVGGRLVLINSVLSSLPLFMLSFLEVPTGVLKRIDSIGQGFFWQYDQQKKTYKLANGMLYANQRNKEAYEL